eukprot:TRINITY_DN17975_c0_g1_i1.p2 TRINITY_DN17975_c0_g1~~TRINITY_DN17975_c0_g1_i1.p2  ORF type:complete len:251 (+),score=79.72 TRINITY_DN17975_c0_g1_i1:320-1072(+)
MLALRLRRSMSCAELALGQAGELQEMVQQGMALVGLGPGDSLGVHQFVHMLLQPPWVSSMPSHVQQVLLEPHTGPQLRSTVLQLCADAPRPKSSSAWAIRVAHRHAECRSARPAAPISAANRAYWQAQRASAVQSGLGELGKQAAARRVVQLVQQLFEAADDTGDGRLDQEELACLWLRLCRRIGAPVPVSRAELMNHVDSALEGEGTIGFDQFLALVCHAPWSQMLPAEVQSTLPGLAMKLLRPKTAKP